MEGKSLRKKRAGPAEAVVVVDAMWGTKQTPWRMRGCQLVELDRVLTSHSLLAKAAIICTSSDNNVVTLNVGGVDLSNVLIVCGATCNLMGQQTWNWLKANGIQ